MAHDQHSNLREGLLAGLLGALIVELWYLAVDAGRGKLFYTSNLLGQVFVRRDGTPLAETVNSGALEYTLVHFAWFCLFGIGLAALIHQAARNPAFRMGVWLYLVIGTVFWFGVSYMLIWLAHQRFPWWSSLIGTVLGIGFMGVYLSRRHPALRATSAPLGDEVRPPPHPRNASRR
jgi:hypothetical protein